MRTQTLFAALLVGFSVGCGGRIADAVPPSNDGGQDTTFDMPDALSDSGESDTGSLESGLDGATQVDSGDSCHYSNGLAVCSVTPPFSCGSPPNGLPPNCGGCATATNASDAVAPIGFCVNTSTAMTGSMPICSVCDTGHLCYYLEAIQIPPDPYSSLQCVDVAYCNALHARGFEGACVYLDKTLWSATDSIPATACPAGGQTLGLCGGSCGDCPAGRVCTGRSPTHPFGVCASRKQTNPIATTTLNLCQRSVGCAQGDACLVFNTNGHGDQTLANIDGFCLPASQCVSLKPVIPGGIFCTAPGGAEL